MKNYILTGTLCMFLLGGCGEHAHDHEHEVMTMKRKYMQRKKQLIQMKSY